MRSASNAGGSPKIVVFSPFGVSVGVAVVGWFAATAALVVSCSDKGDPLFANKSPQEIALLKRGKAIYGAMCIACHNADPRREGALGPALAGAGAELVRLKVLENKYPPGYAPKRPTAQMVMLPHLKDDVPGIVAYLNAMK